jgi:tetratricopeptide (TPR) repeat protein
MLSPELPELLPARALEMYQASLASRQARVTANPGDGEAQRDLSVSQNKLGDFYWHRGEPGDAARALEMYQASLDSSQARVAANPGDGQAQRDLSVSQERLGDYYLRRGGPGDAAWALEMHQTAVEQRRALADSNSDLAELWAELSLPIARVLRISTQLGKEDTAMAALHELAGIVARWHDKGYSADGRIETAKELLGLWFGSKGPE